MVLYHSTSGWELFLEADSAALINKLANIDSEHILDCAFGNIGTRIVNL